MDIKIKMKKVSPKVIEGLAHAFHPRKIKPHQPKKPEKTDPYEPRVK